MVKILGLIAGGGGLPFAVVREARERGVERVVAVGFPGQTAPELERQVDELHWVHVGQLGKLIQALRAAGVSEAVMVGRLDPKLVISRVRLDMRMVSLAMRVRDRRAETVLRAIADEMEKDGVHLLDSTTYLTSQLATRGVMTKKSPAEDVREDIAFGSGIAREIARLDIGQTVVVRRKAVVAIEAMEGTDDTIVRAGSFCERRMVVVKVSLPRLDMRFDVPVVGETTIRLLLRHRAAALAVEAGRTILLDRDTLLKNADEGKLAVVGI